MVRNKKAVTLLLGDADMEMLEDLAKKKDASKTAVIKQALRLYKTVDSRIESGEELVFRRRMPEGLDHLEVFYLI